MTMTAPQRDPDRITARLNRLEARLRRLKRGGLLLLVVALLMGQAGTDPVPKTVEAQMFVLLDADGKTRGFWKMDGATQTLTLRDEGGVDRAILRVFSDGQPQLAFRDEKRRYRSVLLSSRLQLKGEDDRELLSMSVGDGSMGGIEISEPGGANVRMEMLDEGNPQVVLRSRDGRVFFRTPTAGLRAAPAAAGRRPLLVMVAQDPWLMVIGSDSPAFALYDDGLLIYRQRPADRKAPYRSLVLGTEERKQLLSTMFTGEPFPFRELDDGYEVTQTTDQPLTTVYTWLDGERRAVTVYGLNPRPPEKRWAGMSEEERQDLVKGPRAKTPQPFLRVFDHLIDYRDARAEPWLPERVEVMVWPFDSKMDPLAWPEKWPDLDHPTTRKRGEAYSIYLEVERLENLRALLRKRQMTQAILINGKKWAISYRFPFPGERAWVR